MAEATNLTPLANLRVALEQVQKQGKDQIEVAVLLNAVKALEKTAPTPEATLEQYKASLQVWVKHHEMAKEAERQMFQSVLDTAQAAQKTIILINGGACVALLAFIGAMVQANKSVFGIGVGLLFFAMGLACAACSSAGTYFAQFAFHFNDDTSRKGWGWRKVAIIFGVSSIVMFVAGCLVSFFTFIR